MSATVRPIPVEHIEREHVGTELSVWCPACALPSAARFRVRVSWLTATGAGSLHASKAVCLQCGADVAFARHDGPMHDEAQP